MPFTWKKVGVWVAIEATRGEKQTTMQYRFPRTDNTFFDKANIESDSWAVDTIVDSINSEVTKQRAEWTIWGQVYPNGIWFFLKALLWNVESSWADWVYEHNFSLLESNTHPTLTVWTSTPLWWSCYPLAMIESMDFTAEVGGKFTVSINLKSKKWETQTHEVSYIDESGFIANMLKVFLADNVNWLDIADNICLQSITISIKKEIKDIECLSSIDPIDYINSSFSIEGSMEMLFEDNTYKDYFLNWTPKALRILAEDTKHPYEWVENYPTFMLDLAKVVITDWTPAFTIDDVTKQSISFKGHYDVKSKKAIEVYLKNTQPSYDGNEEPEWDPTFTSEEIWNPEDNRYEYHFSREIGNKYKTIILYQNHNTQVEWLSRSLVRVKWDNWDYITEESNTQINYLTWNRIINNHFKYNAEDFTQEDWDFLWNFSLDTSYIHYFISKYSDYDYQLGKVYLDDTSSLIDPYPFTISHDDTLIKHGYYWNEIVAWGQEALDMIAYVHNNENTIVDNDNLEAEIRELNRYSYNMRFWTNWVDFSEYEIFGNHSWLQDWYYVRNDNWDYSIFKTNTWETISSDSTTWDDLVLAFEQFIEDWGHDSETQWLPIDNTQYNTVMGIINWDTITEVTYEWTDEVQ